MENFLPSLKAKKRKQLGHFCLWVYNFEEEKFGGSPHLFAPLAKGYKQNLEKKCFLGLTTYDGSGAPNVGGVGQGQEHHCLLLALHCEIRLWSWVRL